MEIMRLERLRVLDLCFLLRGLSLNSLGGQTQLEHLLQRTLFT